MEDFGGAEEVTISCIEFVSVVSAVETRPKSRLERQTRVTFILGKRLTINKHTESLCCGRSQCRH